MELTQLRALDGVVREGGFTAASKTLFLTQPGVSRAVATLEAELGFPLLTRSKSGVAVTDAGRIVLAQVRGILAAIEHLEQEAAAIRGLDAGTLRVAGIPSACSRLVPGIFRAFEERYPKVSVVLHEDFHDQIVRAVKQHEVDLGFVHLPLEDVRCVPIATDQLCLVVPADHRLAVAEEPIDLRDLAGESFIQHCSRRSDQLIQELFAATGIDPPVRFTLQHVNTVLDMIASGMGVALIAELALPTYPCKLAVKRVMPTRTRSIGIGMARQEKVLPAAAAFVHVAQSLTKTGLTCGEWNSVHSRGSREPAFENSYGR